MTEVPELTRRQRQEIEDIAIANLDESFDEDGFYDTLEMLLFDYFRKAC